MSMSGFAGAPLCELDDLDPALPGRRGGTKEAKGALSESEPEEDSEDELLPETRRPREATKYLNISTSAITSLILRT